jgi:prepilin-type N-terminal cleavage/methylation domain-containing protein
MKNLRDKRGFTLVEVLFAILVGLLLLSAIYFAMTTGQMSSAGLERKVAAQQDVRAVLQTMSLELSMASYNPNFIPSLWVNPANCATATSQASKGIQEVGDNVIAVEMDIGESNLIGDNYNGSANDNEVIRYEYVNTNGEQYITREIRTCPQGGGMSTGGGQPFLGDAIGSPNPRTVRVINSSQNPVVPVFSYFDSRGNRLTSFPNDIPNIRRIDIALMVETDEVDPSTNRRRQMSYSTSVVLRNHAMN